MKKLKPEVKKELELLAKQLPAAINSKITVQRLLPGVAVNRHNPTATDKDGSKVEDNKKYLFEDGHLKIDHFKKMRKLFLALPNEKEGWVAVNYYFREVTKRFSGDTFDEAKMSKESL
jgi:hypothetical protein